LAIKVSENSSSFKKKIFSLNIGDHIYATSLDGNFTLPTSTKRPLVFITGGIGVTPFASMVRQ